MRVVRHPESSSNEREVVAPIAGESAGELVEVYMLFDGDVTEYGTVHTVSATDRKGMWYSVTFHDGRNRRFAKMAKILRYSAAK